MTKGHLITINLYYLDMGGPLNEGYITEIEDLSRRPCVTCPWHSYKIMLDTGEGIYKNDENSYQSKGLRQRLHPLKFIYDKNTGQENIYVKIMTAEKAGSELPSDHYAALFLQQGSLKGSLNKKKEPTSNSNSTKSNEKS